MAFTESEYTGLTNQKIAAIFDTTTSRLFQKVILYDASGNAIATTNLANGRGLNVVVLNESATKGVDLVGDDLTGALPLYMGGYACSSLANATPLTDNKLHALKQTVDGRLLTLNGGNPEDQLPTTPVVALNDTGSHQLIAAVAADQKIALWGLEVMNLSATPTGVIILNGATEIGRFGIPANPGRIASTPIAPLRGTVNTAMNYQLTAAVGANQVFFTPYAFRTKV